MFPWKIGKIYSLGNNTKLQKYGVSSGDNTDNLDYIIINRNLRLIL